MAASVSPSAPPREIAIDLNGVTVHTLAAPRRAVLEHVNWKVAGGDFWAVAGLQGSGKTDLMMLLSGLMSPVEGIYRLFGEVLGSGYEQDTLSLRLQVGLVFDGGQLLHHLTVRQNIALPIQYHRNCHAEDCRETVDALLELASLDEFAQALPGEIKRHAQLRAGLARALALRPRLLLLDCPLSGLDPREVSWWLRTLGRLGEGHALLGHQPLTMVVTDSDLATWKHCARQFAILKDKRLVTLEKGLAPADHAEKLNRELLGTELEIE